MLDYDIIAQQFVYSSQAVRQSLYGRPGVSYVEIPGNMVTDGIDSTDIE